MIQTIYSSQNVLSNSLTTTSIFTSLGRVSVMAFIMIFCSVSPTIAMDVYHINDNYIVNSKGEIELYEKTDDDFDRLIIVENKKNIIHYKKNGAIRNANIELEKGILSNITELQKEYQGEILYGTKLDFNNKESEAKRVFEFLADHIYVEWAIVNYETNEENRIQIYTSHLRTLEIFGAAQAVKLSMSPTIVSIEHCHSHPRAPWEEVGLYAFPSKEDLNFRDQILNSGIKYLEFTIRTDGDYLDYGRNSEWYSGYHI